MKYWAKKLFNRPILNFNIHTLTNLVVGLISLIFYSCSFYNAQQFQTFVLFPVKIVFLEKVGKICLTSSAPRSFHDFSSRRAQRLIGVAVGWIRLGQLTEVCSNEWGMGSTVLLYFPCSGKNLLGPFLKWSLQCSGSES